MVTKMKDQELERERKREIKEKHSTEIMFQGNKNNIIKKVMPDIFA